TPMVLDAVISHSKRTNQFVKIIAENGSGPWSTSHLRGQVPDGGNAVYMDGHVQWVPFKKMMPRYNSNGSPYWFW
ncbi:MAG: hypothetical protein KIT22_15630, partial [Verrucomicrobiae bacterium]|nr:hypothetical protein [Verrucomicrobiae bacterium]